MSDEPFLKCPCQNCRDTIEFPAQGVGLTIECPHCGQRTVLTGPAPVRPEAMPPPAATEAPAPRPPAEPASATGSAPARSKSLVLLAAVLVAGALAGGAYWYFKVKPGNNQAESANQAESVSAANPSKPTSADATHEPPPKDTTSTTDTARIDKSIEDLKPGAVTLEKAKSGSLIYAVGTLKNESGLQRFGVKVEIDLTDAKGRPAGKATDYTQVIEPRQEWRFRALVLDSKAAAGKVVRVKED